MAFAFGGMFCVQTLHPLTEVTHAVLQPASTALLLLVLLLSRKEILLQILIYKIRSDSQLYF